MKKIGLFAVLLFAVSGLAVAQSVSGAHKVAPPKGQSLPAEVVVHNGKIITPPISDPHRMGAHTNFKIFVPDGQKTVSAAVPDYTFAEDPASINCVYGTGPHYAGCAPAYLRNVESPSGGSRAIAVVEAYHDQYIISNLATFSAYWGLPAANAEVIIANSSWGSNLGGGYGPEVNASCSGTPPEYPNNLGWDVEESLDAEWAHTMAPYAYIFIVEACTQNLEDLLYAEYVASELVYDDFGGGQVSNSWGYSEPCANSSSCNGGLSSTEVEDDNFFYRYFGYYVTYLASAGDAGSEVLFPSASPWVVSVGGTQIDRDVNENFVDESCWVDSGGGFSTYETWQSPPNILNGLGPWSDYQYQLFGGYPYATPYRSTPDISFDASLASGVWVYDTDEGGSWYVVGGTSVGSPSVAGIINKAGNFLGDRNPTYGYFYTGEDDLLYAQLNSSIAYPTNFYDVTTGSNGHAAGTGYDQCTGIGSPRGLLGK